ncbi:hypothetical protein [Spirosoma arcticum]
MLKELNTTFDYITTLVASLMGYSIKNEPFLKRILWLDTLAGGATSGIGFLCYVPLTTTLGVTASFILVVAAINLIYALLALTVATQKPTSVRLVRLLIYANWGWTAISVGMIFIHFGHVTKIGDVLLLIQPILVGGLAYLEANQVVAKRTT